MCVPAFEDTKGLRLIQRNATDQFAVYPSNHEHRAIAKVFKAVIEKNWKEGRIRVRGVGFDFYNPCLVLPLIFQFKDSVNQEK